MNYRINREAIIFLDRDSEAGFQTIAYDWQSGDLYAVRPLEYNILRFIYEHEPVPEPTICDWAKSDLDLDEVHLNEIMEILVNKKIILVDEQ